MHKYYNHDIPVQSRIVLFAFSQNFRLSSRKCNDLVRGVSSLPETSTLLADPYMLLFGFPLQQNQGLMILQGISVDQFFTTPISSNVHAFSCEVPQLQAFYSPDQDFANPKKITLTENYLLLSEKREANFTITHYFPLDLPLKFRRIFDRKEGMGGMEMGRELLGFDLINSQHQTTSIYIQHSELAKIWVKWLSKNLTELGFGCSYRKIRQIGKGTSASVWEVQRVEDGKIFAAKAFQKEYLAAKEDRKDGLENEISLLREFDHSNVLKLQAVLESESAIYLICEKLSGGNIFQRINITKGFTLTEVRQIMRGILSGLEYLHKFDIAHRDIKLENIIFRDENSLDPVIADFGLATFTDDEPNTFKRCGTPGFVAPEIIRVRENRRVRVSCDIFSAGVVFHILLTNRYLFEGNNSKQTYNKNMKAQFNLDGKIYSGLDRQALQLMRRMLCLKPNERIKASDALQSEFLMIGDQPFQKEGISPVFTEAGEENLI